MIVAGVPQLDLPQRFAAARRRLWFHAPPYGRFADSPALCKALDTALSQPDGPHLTIATLPDIDNTPWMPDFMRLLRPQLEMSKIRRELAASDTFLQQMRLAYGARVSIRTLLVRPALPALLIDDCICFGHFAHSATLTPDGFWCAVTAPVEALLQRAGQNAADTAADLPPEQRAAYRIIGECLHSTCPASSAATDQQRPPTD